MIRRSAIILLTLASLAMTGLWVRSYVHIDGLGHSSGDGTSVSCSSDWGSLTCVYQVMPSRLFTGDSLGRGFSCGSISIAEQERQTARLGETLRRVGSTWGVRTSRQASGAGSWCGEGFDYWCHDTNILGERMLVRRVSVPHWLILGILAAYPCVSGSFAARRNLRRRRRHTHDQCLTCGYSLTGNTSGTCPECGQEVRA